MYTSVSGTHLGPVTRFLHFHTVAGLLMWGALSDDRACLLLIAVSVGTMGNIYIFTTVSAGILHSESVAKGPVGCEYRPTPDMYCDVTERLQTGFTEL
jgi:hypothetical protein